MPKIKTGLLVQCAMRNARGASKGTKERAPRSNSRFSSVLLFWYHSYHAISKKHWYHENEDRPYRQGNASPGPLAAEAACKARCLDKETG